MPVKYGEYEYVFDSVQFGIDVRRARKNDGELQEEVARQIGKETSGVISAIECATYDEHLLMRDFIAICKHYDLHPFDYFDMQRRLHV